MPRQSIEDLLKQLKVHSKSDDHESVLNYANHILFQSSNDLNAIHSKIVALIKLDKFTQALKFINENSNKSTIIEKYPIEYEYILYKTENFDKLYEQYGDRTDRASLHILAQAKYRQEDLIKAEEFYNKITYADSTEESDIAVNKSAVQALKVLLGGEKSKSELSSPKTDSYDYIFNLATIEIGAGNYTKALQLLSEAQMICKDSPFLQTPEDVAEELAPILIQAAYINERLGNYNEAKSILKDNIQGLSSGLVKLIGANNLYVLEQKENHGDVKMDGEATTTATISPTESLNNSINAIKSSLKSVIDLENAAGNQTELNQRINSLQKSLISHNTLLLKLHSGRDITSSINQFVKENPTKLSIKSLSILSKVSGEDESEKTIIKKLHKLLERETKTNSTSTTLSLPIALTLAQLYVNNKNFDAAAETLENALKHTTTITKTYFPGLIASLVNIYTLQHRTKSAIDLIADAFKAWTSSSTSSAPINLTTPASILARSDVSEYHKLAFDYFKEEYSLNPSSPSLAAGLLSTGNEQAVSNYTTISSNSSLPSISSITSSIDANSLNDAGISHLLLKRTSEESTQSSTKRRKTTTKKPSKLPQNYDASKQPDPERWLPKRDRSTWKPKRKDKRNAKTTQGGSVDNTTESVIQQPTTSVVQSKSSPALKNKKKKKSKR